MKRTIHISFICVMLIGSTLPSSAQLLGGSPFRNAHKEYEIFAFNKAIESYKDGLKRRPDDAEALGKLADCYRHLNQMEEAATYYAQAVRQRDVNPIFRLQYAHTLKALGQYDEARLWYTEYAKTNPGEGAHFVQSCHFAQAQQSVPAVYTVTNDMNNTTSSEFGPAFYGDNQVAFASARVDLPRPGLPRNTRVNNQLFVASISSRSGFMESLDYLRTNVREASGEGPVAFTPDRRWVAFTKNNFVDGTRHLASSGMQLSLHIGEVTASGDWINVRPFQYNGSNFSVGFPSFSPDGKALYFASNRPDGFGGYDIYVSYRIGEGNNWSTPENLGPVVNSPGNEVTPFFDGATLFFSSDWHQGFGGYDVFRAESSNNRWVRIFHLGNGINSPRDDYGFIFDSARNRGYLVSNRPGGRGNEDIYRVTRSADNVTIIVKNAADGTPLPNVAIDFSSCGERSEMTDAKGIFSFQAVQGLDCNLAFRKDGYLNQSYQFTTGTMRLQSREIEVMLTRIGEEYAGRLVNYTNRIPVEGATITATNQTTNTTMSTLTDANGDYILALSPNTTYVVRYSSPGFRDVSRTVRTAGRFERDVLGIMELIPVGVNVRPETDITPKGPETPTSPSTVQRGFAVQAAAVRTPSLSGYNDLRNFGTLYAKEEGGVYKIRVGVFTTREEAQRVLRLVNNQGYEGAFIVQETGGATTTESTPAKDLTPKSPAEDPFPTSGRYKIQLAAYRDVKNFDSSKIRGLGAIEDQQRGNFTVKYLASYTTIEEARRVLREAQTAGFKDAFIVENVNGNWRKTN